MPPPFVPERKADFVFDDKDTASMNYVREVMEVHVPNFLRSFGLYFLETLYLWLGTEAGQNAGLIPRLRADLKRSTKAKSTEYIEVLREVSVLILYAFYSAAFS
jgi:hypothetical protein